MANSIDPQRQVQRLAAVERAVSLVRDGMTLGLGSGTTAVLALPLIAARLAQGWRLAGVPTSRETEREAQRLGIPLVSLDTHPTLDLTIDGADEVDPGCNVVKGRGGALLREKIVAACSRYEVIVVDEEKLVRRLGERSLLPVEVVPFGREPARRRLAALGLEPTLRQREGQPYLTDNGNLIFDCRLDPGHDPAALAREICAVPGVVAHGLFLGLVDLVLVGTSAGVRELTPPSPPPPEAGSSSSG